MISLRNKIILSLIGTSFLAIAFTALIARILMVSEFDHLVENRAAEEFMQGALEFYQLYGSWETAFATEPLFEFAQRRRRENQLSELDTADETALRLTPDGYIAPQSPPTWVAEDFPVGGPPPNAPPWASLPGQPSWAAFLGSLPVAHLHRPMFWWT